jgi:hypothetical protein
MGAGPGGVRAARVLFRGASSDVGGSVKALGRKEGRNYCNGMTL